MADYLNIAGRIRTTASDGVAMEAQEVKDLNQNKSQQEINADVQTELGDRYTKEETYNREELNELITTPDVNRVYVIATNLTTAVTDLLPETGSSDTLYNVGNWNGTQYDTTVYSIYGWDGSAYVCLAVRSFVGEVYDISVNHPDGHGNPTPYADLAAALGTGGANIPADIRRGGMRIQFIQGTAQSSDNKYVQFRYMSSSTAVADFTNVDNWQGVDVEPMAGSNNLVVSEGIQRDVRVSSSNIRGLDFSSFTGNTKNYTKGIIFAGVVLADGYNPSDKPKITGLSKNRNNDGYFRLQVQTDIGGDSHQVNARLTLSTIEKSSCGIVSFKFTGTLGTLYAIINIDAYTDGEVVKYNTSAPFVYINTILPSDQRIQNWNGEINLSTLREDVNGVTSDIGVINTNIENIETYINNLLTPSLFNLQQQYRCLDFSNTTFNIYNRERYYKSIIFAASVWRTSKPEWASPKLEISALAYNHHSSDKIDFGFYIGNDGTSDKNIWYRINNVSQLDEVPEFISAKVSTDDYGGLDVYLICSPKYLYDNNEDIIYGGTAGKRVCIDNLTSEDPRIQAFNMNNNILQVKTELEAEIAGIGNGRFWKNKKLVWFGTSIPAGSDSTLEQEGIGITYPDITASFLQARCSNEAVGSSRATYLPPSQRETYDHLMRCMGGTIASKLAIFDSIYIIDDNNQTVTLGANPYNVTDLPVSGVPTYSQATSLRAQAIRYSYEVKLVSKYLDSTGEYIRNILNSQEVAEYIHYSGTGYQLLYNTKMDYIETPALFVFDHGTNDYPSMSSSDDVTTRDVTKFYGAMNMMYDIIQFYAPKALVCIVTDYGTSRYNSDIVITEQQNWAKYWQIPCLKTCDLVPWNGTIVTLQGYWDGGTAQGGEWHDTGFYFNVDGDSWETNNGVILRNYSSSTPASTIISQYNIRNIRGVQVYDLPQKQKFFKDGLHPHTDTTGNALKLYARYLSRLICDFVAPNKD